MALAQWITIDVHPHNFVLSIKNAKLNWGKFHKNGDKYSGVSAEEINKLVINSGDHAIISSCGREDSASGTGGSFDFYDGDKKVGTFYWDCPWGSGTNTIHCTTADEHYILQEQGANRGTGPIGNVRIKLVRK